MSQNLDKQLKALDAEAHDNLCKSNSLAERCQQIPAEIAALERQIMTAETEQEIDQLFTQIEALKSEQTRKNLMSRRHEILRLKSVEEKATMQYNEARTQWVNAIDELPQLVENVELADKALEAQKAVASALEAKLVNYERAIEQAQIERIQLENLSL